MIKLGTSLGHPQIFWEISHLLDVFVLLLFENKRWMVYTHQPKTNVFHHPQFSNYVPSKIVLRTNFQKSKIIWKIIYICGFYNVLWNGECVVFEQYKACSKKSEQFEILIFDLVESHTYHCGLLWSPFYCISILCRAI